MTLQVCSLKIAEKHLPRYVSLCLPSVKHVQELSRPEPVAAVNTRQSASSSNPARLLVFNEQKPQDTVLQPVRLSKGCVVLDGSTEEDAASLERFTRTCRAYSCPYVTQYPLECTPPSP